MLRYLPGLVLLQLVTLALFVFNAGADVSAMALRAGLPALALALITALWFRSLSRADGERDLARTRLELERERERERERLLGEAAQERESVLREAERERRRESRRVGRRASVQVGLAFAATGAMGVLLVLSELVTLGLLTLSAGGGALGGYVLRWRQTRSSRAERHAGRERGIAGQGGAGLGNDGLPVVVDGDERVGDGYAVVERLPAPGALPVPDPAAVTAAMTTSTPRRRIDRSMPPGRSRS